MKKTAIFTMGTRGDVQPYIFLSKELIKNGYEVTLGSHPCWRALVEDAGIHFEPIGPDIDIEKEAAAIRGAVSNPALSMLKTMNFVFRIIQESTTEVYEACKGKDLIIVSHSQMGAVEAGVLGIPTVNVTLQTEMIGEKLRPQTFKDKVIGEFPDIVYSISATTRKPREGEVDGVHYFFKTKEAFEKLIQENGLIEWNEVHGNYYGTPKFFVEDMLKQGKRVLFDLDVFGKVNFDKVYPEATGILILPPSEEELERRLRSRGTDSEESIQTRLKNAKKEMEFAKTQGKYEYTIVNDDLEKAADQLRKILSA